MNSLHTHLDYSNILGFPDSTNKAASVVKTAKQLGLTSVALTDHGVISGWVKWNQQEAQNPDLKFIYGCEIYLTADRHKNQKYHHCIILAKDQEGIYQLKELCSIGWLNSYWDRGLQRIPITTNELTEVVSKSRGHLIMSSACLGGTLPWMFENKKIDELHTFIQWTKWLFDTDFYLEAQPNEAGSQQDKWNRELLNLAREYRIRIIATSDAHYLRPEDAKIHTAFLRSKQAERETEDFYKYTYLMSEEEMRELLHNSYSDKQIDWIFEANNEIENKIQKIVLKQTSHVVQIPVKEYSRDIEIEDIGPTLSKLIKSEETQSRYWANECINSLQDKNLWNKEYLDRLELEADIIQTISDNLNSNMFAYFNMMKHYIDLAWEIGSPVGVARGSSPCFISCFLLGIVDVDGIENNFDYWRFLDKDRAELPDIDYDISPSLRPKYFEAIRQEWGTEQGLSQIITFGTETSKAAIQTACRGLKIDVDEAQYLSSLIQVERGFVWPLKDMVYGNKDKDRAPQTQFINAIAKYEGLIETAMGIEGLISRQGIHASGVILYDRDPHITTSFMRSKKGDLITAFDLHDQEYLGDVKIDVLVTEVQDMFLATYNLLKKHKEIDENLSLKEWYNETISPDKIDFQNSKIWEHLTKGSVINIFQFNEASGKKIARKLQPQSIDEMTACNALMRMMSQPGREPEDERFLRFKNDWNEFIQELRDNNIPVELREKLTKLLKTYNGVAALQELMMKVLMECANFTMSQAQNARKVVGKKLMSQIPILHKQIIESSLSPKIGEYIYETFCLPSLGYAFNAPHSTSYSIIGVQTIWLNILYDPIYWNTANLLVLGGMMTEESNGTNYNKIARIVSTLSAQGVNIRPLSINKSHQEFTIDKENNSIYLGFDVVKGMKSKTVEEILTLRPFTSFQDFLNKTSADVSSVIGLIKSQAFSELNPLSDIKDEYAWYKADVKRQLNGQNFSFLSREGLWPEGFNEERLLFNFNTYLKKLPFKNGYYELDERAGEFLNKIGYEWFEELDSYEWNKFYKKQLEPVKAWLKEYQEEYLEIVNSYIVDKFKEEKLSFTAAQGEIEAVGLCFSPHELFEFNSANFDKLSEDGEVESVWEKNGRDIPIYKLSTLRGVVIANDKMHGNVTLLTKYGPVDLNYRKEEYAHYAAQISQKKSDGTKKIIEKSWFNRGSWIQVLGRRNGAYFIPKKYKNSKQLYTTYKITGIDYNQLTFQTERSKGIIEEETE